MGETIHVHTKLNGATDLDTDDVEGMARVYIQLTDLSKKINAETEKVKKSLLPHQPNVRVQEMKKKVVFEEGRTKTAIDVSTFYRKFREMGHTAEEFLGMVSLSKSSIEKSDLTKEERATLLGAAEKTTGQEKSMVRVKDMTAEELAE